MTTVDYRDLAGDYIQRRDRFRIARDLTHRLETLGFKVALEAT